MILLTFRAFSLKTQKIPHPQGMRDAVQSLDFPEKISAWSFQPHLFYLFVVCSTFDFRIYVRSFSSKQPIKITSFFLVYLVVFAQ